MRRRRVKVAVLMVTPPIVLLLMWQLFADQGWIDRRFFPAPTVIFEAFKDLVASGALQDHLLATGRRVLIGLPIGALVGIVAGLLMGSNPLVRSAFQPLIAAAYSVPKLAIFPLLLLIFGIGDKPKIILVVIAVGLITTIGTMGAVAAVPKELIDVARSLRVDRRHMFTEVILPSCLPSIFVNLRIGAGIAILAVVATEFVEASSGIGHLIWNSWVLFKPADMYVGIIMSAAFGFIVSSIISFIGTRLTPWAADRQDTRTIF